MVRGRAAGRLPLRRPDERTVRGTAALPFDTADPARSDADDAVSGADAPAPDMDADLAALTPPRWHYRRFYATRGANDDLRRAPQGVHDFLRAYYHMKSGDWSGNRPEPLREWSAAELARLPRYYVLDLGRGMAETVAEHMPSAAEIAACEWLPDDELRVYSAEYERTGFQGGLQWYRSVASVSSIFGGGINADLQVFAGRTIDQPSLFIAGARDWGIHQRPGGAGADGVAGLHRPAGSAPAGRSRPLGAAGAVGRGQPPRPRLPGIGLTARSRHPDVLHHDAQARGSRQPVVGSQ